MNHYSEKEMAQKKLEFFLLKGAIKVLQDILRYETHILGDAPIVTAWRKVKTGRASKS